MIEHDGVLVGRKNISKYLDVHWDTVRRWKRKYGCPIHSRPGGRPVALIYELVIWLEVYSSRRDELEKWRDTHHMHTP